MHFPNTMGTSSVMTKYALLRKSLALPALTILLVGCGQNPSPPAKDTSPPREAALIAEDSAAINKPVSFNQDIRPILSENCFFCHGPDEAMREKTGGIRLDSFEGATADYAGASPLVPGDTESSAIISRINADNHDRVMPPPDSNLALSAEEIALLTRWIEEGGDYADHWAFVAPVRPEVPTASGGWGHNAIDGFIHARLEEAALSPMPEAEKATLIRRVTLDLTGLPATLEEIDAFLADTSEDAYETLVDRLLLSPRFGEHKARYWLDAVRYADTHGYHLDNERSVWPYRDWVIAAFNDNKPFNQFVEHQLGGDLLDSPTTDQLVASGFVRMNPTTGEGGAIDEEYLVKYAIDRVNTTSTIFLGLTVGCAQCHDHKYDPISQTEYYQLFAYFNSTAEAAMDGNALAPAPSIRVMTDDQQAQADAFLVQADAIEQEIAECIAAIQYEEPADLDAIPAPTHPAEFVWIEDDTPPGANLQGNGQDPHWRWVAGADAHIYSGARATHRQAAGLNQHFFTGAADPLVLHEGDILFAWVYLDPANPPEVVQLQFNNGDWNHRARWGVNKAHASSAGGGANFEAGPLPETGVWVRLETDIASVGLSPGDRLNGWAFTQFGGSVYYDRAGVLTMHPPDARYKVSRAVWESRSKDDSDIPQPIRTILALDTAARSPEQDRTVTDYYLRHVHEPTRQALLPLTQEMMSLRAQAEQIKAAAPFTLVARELDTPRPAYLLHRGEYDQKGEQIERGLPAALPTMPEDAEQNRLGLAMWLTDPAHPLTSRVAVNRIWQQYFGTGLVKTTEDMGSQGEWPSHPDLLDWLAVEFVASGWDVKHIHRLIDTSAAYRQQSRITEDHLRLDPDNRLISRGPRRRLDAEVMRDQALFMSGLLVERIGGPSVKPYQPAGLWFAVGYSGSNTVRFVRGDGEDLYRRSMYTFWKRTSPPPSMSMFDAPSRESCSVSRSQTNTPLQALVTLNDIQFVEAARAFAQRVILEGGGDTDGRITYAFRLATGRVPRENELSVLRNIYSQQLAAYQNNPEAAAALIALGESTPNPEINPADLAAMTIVANTLLNLDEVLTQH